MNIEERLWRSYARTGDEWRYRIYFIVSYINDWWFWFYASSLERWTVYVAMMLVAILAGLVLARIIGG